MRRIPPVCFVASIVGMSLVFSGCTKTGPPNVTAQHSISDEIRQGLAAGGSSSGGGDSAPTQDPTGFATLRGTFLIDQGALGSLPPMVALAVTGSASEMAVCAPGGKTVYSDALRVDKTSGGISDVVIFLTGKGVADSWIHESALPGKTEPAVFDQKNCVFLSHVFALQTSQRLILKNSDSVGHNANLKPTKSTPFNQTVLANKSLSYQHTREEPQPYSASCGIHPWMTAWIFPRDNSYVAVSGKDGTFEIPNLPAGVDLEFRVWHEKTSWVDYTGWKKGRFKVALVADEETSMDIAIDPAIFN